MSWMEARNRKIADWYNKIKRGEIKLPRFQRYEAWDKHRISSLVETVIRNLPLGITLILEVGVEEKFISRPLPTAPDNTTEKVTEHLLDGQQRLTALWRVFHNNYNTETYYVRVKEFDEHSNRNDDEPDISIYVKTRYFKIFQNELVRYPLWCDQPEECLKRGLIPTNLLR
ncbi:MAG: DUF262 domain-containing protein, partial [Thermoplasmata archaeon]|nr:DUF262 domain-containing protein [Thermoplasmata archaeon]